MYIPEFVCGVAATLLLEFGIVMVFVIGFALDGKKDNSSNKQKDDPVPTSTYGRDGKMHDGEF